MSRAIDKRWEELKELADQDILDLVYPADMRALMSVAEAAQEGEPRALDAALRHLDDVLENPAVVL